MVKAEANKAVDKLHIREAIVVEGRDDVDAVSKACDALIIATHGFGITGDTWALIEKAYDELGIIIMTDPDYSGEEIRRRLTAKFPNALHAYMPRSEAITHGFEQGTRYKREFREGGYNHGRFDRAQAGWICGILDTS